MKLYHGTNSKNLDKIVTEGLVPRLKGRGNWQHSIMSRKDAIYLTDAYAPYFAINAVKDDSKERALIVEVETERLNFLNLVPDEDALEQSSRHMKDGSGPSTDWDMKKRTKWYRDRLENYVGHEQWKFSLKAMGNCAHIGPIPTIAIRRFALIELRKAPTLYITSLDPMITILNYRILGKKYRGMIKWIFGDDLGEDAPTETITEEQFAELAASGVFKNQHAEAMRYDYILPPEEEREAIKVVNFTP